MSRMTTYRGFGNGQIVDISNYKGKKEEAQDRTKRGKFLYIGFFDLNKYYLPNGKPNLSHPDLLNISIRSKQINKLWRFVFVFVNLYCNFVNF